jgi:hypothetical protein
MADVFTRSMVAGDIIVILASQGCSYISVLCKTDNSGSNGVTITGQGNLAGISSNAIVLKENESFTIQQPGSLDIGNLRITCDTASTAIVVSM